MKTEMQQTELYQKFSKVLGIDDRMSTTDNQFVVDCCKIAEEYANQKNENLLKIHAGTVNQSALEVLQLYMTLMERSETSEHFEHLLNEHRFYEKAKSVLNPKHYGIYQFHVDELFEERKLLVAITIGNSEEDAINNYLSTEIVKEHRDFIKGYLSALEWSGNDFLKDIQNKIAENLKTVGIWSGRIIKYNENNKKGQ